MNSESSHFTTLRSLLHGARVAALATYGLNQKVYQSMVPFAIDTDYRRFILHVSSLAPHTQNMGADANVSLLIMRAEAANESVHDLPRVSLSGLAHRLEVNSDSWKVARLRYLQRFPEAEPMTTLGDFQFFGVDPLDGRFIAGFGAAHLVRQDHWDGVLSVSDK